MPQNIQKARSVPRTQAREAEKKIVPAIKMISASVGNTRLFPDNFKGYKLPAGDFMANGRKWQYQIIATCAKSEFMKKDECIPMFKGWTFWLKVKAFAKHLVDMANS